MTKAKYLGHKGELRTQRRLKKAEDLLRLVLNSGYVTDRDPVDASSLVKGAMYLLFEAQRLYELHNGALRQSQERGQA
jgi:hypothetical protein